MTPIMIMGQVTIGCSGRDQRAVRVIEIPTPRWTVYDVKFFNVKMPEDTKMQVQERAYTSPIWYTP